MSKNIKNKNRNFLKLKLFFFLVPILFLFGKVKTASAVAPLLVYGAYAGATAIAGYLGAGIAKDTFEYVFKLLLYGLLELLGMLLSVAITLFGWAIKPEYFQQLFNLSNVYGLWQFVRDFFNLFFILILLYIAFTVVFQIQKNFKQALLSLVLAALLVNFSFPISRFLIDVTNVPMYFFINQISGSNDEVLGTVLSASHIKDILIPPLDDLGDFDFSYYFMAIITMFLLAVSLLVLAIMLLVRLLALLILVIFSSVGFAAAIIPGLKEYHDMWWQNFWKYALFGPAAALMLLISIRFLSDIQGQQVMKSLESAAGNVSQTSGEGTFIASIALFSVPIILLWMTIGLAQKFSIVGAAAVSGKGQAFAKWAGRKTYNNPVTRGIGGGLKEKTGINKFQKWMARPSSTEAALKGGVIGAGTAAGIRGGARKELTGIREKEVQEKFEEHKKNKTNASILEEDLKSKDGVKRKAAALALADSKDITSPERLHLALAAVAGDMDRYAKVLQSADGKAMGMSADDMQKAVAERDENGAIKKDAAGNVMVNDNALKAVSSKMKKEGRIDVVVDYRVKKGGEKQADVLREVIDKLDAKEIPKQGDLLKHAVYGNDARIAVQDYQITDPDHYQQIKRNATGEINKLI